MVQPSSELTRRKRFLSLATPNREDFLKVSTKKSYLYPKQNYFDFFIVFFLSGQRKNGQIAKKPSDKKQSSDRLLALISFWGVLG
jgi:hypothetical protein